MMGCMVHLTVLYLIMLLSRHWPTHLNPLLKIYCKKSSIWGPTCDAMDCILPTCHLPKLNIGDWIIFENMGAYTLSAASTFNGSEAPTLKFILPFSMKDSLSLRK